MQLPPDAAATPLPSTTTDWTLTLWPKQTPPHVASVSIVCHSDKDTQPLRAPPPPPTLLQATEVKVCTTRPAYIGPHTCVASVLLTDPHSYSRPVLSVGFNCVSLCGGLLCLASFWGMAQLLGLGATGGEDQEGSDQNGCKENNPKQPHILCVCVCAHMHSSVNMHMCRCEKVPQCVCGGDRRSPSPSTT